MENVKKIVRSLVHGAGEAGKNYVDRAKCLYDCYNRDSVSGEELSTKRTFVNHLHFVGGHACWYFGLACIGGSFLPRFLGEKDYEVLESRLQFVGLSVIGAGAFFSSVFYSRIGSLKCFKDSFLKNPKETSIRMIGGLVDSQIVAPTYKLMLLGRLTEGPRKTANNFGEVFIEKVVDPSCLDFLDYLQSKGKIGRGLENLMIKSSEGCYSFFY